MHPWIAVVIGVLSLVVGGGPALADSPAVVGPSAGVLSLAAQVVQNHLAGQGVLSATAPLVTDAAVSDNVLAQLAQSSDWRVASQAHAALVWRSDPQAAARVMALQTAPTRGGGERLLGGPAANQGESAVLVQRLVHGGEPTPVRFGLASALGGRADVVPAQWLGVLGSEPEPQVRQALLLGLRRAPVPTAQPALAQALTDPDPAVRSAALIHAVRHPKAAAFANTFLAALADPDPQVRARACQAVGWFQLASGWDPLVQRLGDTHAGVRLRALMALVRLDPGRAAALPQVADLRQDPDSRVSRMAANIKF